MHSEYIIDVTEYTIQRPKYNQNEYYSGKKHTIKIQLLINTESNAIIIYDLDSESVHDFECFKKIQINCVKILHC